MRWSVSMRFSSVLTLRQRDHQVAPIYLFMRLYQMAGDSYCRSPDVYWSRMLDGTNPMTEIAEIVHGLPYLTVRGEVHHLGHDNTEDNRIVEFYRACGFDPNPDKQARRFSLLPIEVLPRKSYPLRYMNGLMRNPCPAKSAIPRRRHSISNLAEFTMQVYRRWRGVPIPTGNSPNKILSVTEMDWMG